MGSELPSFDDFAKFKGLCRHLIQHPKDIGTIKLLNSLLDSSPDTFTKVIQPSILSTFYPILKNISEDKKSYSDNEKQLIVDTFKILFKKSVIDKLGLFFNIYSFLLFEIYDHLQHKILPIQEEYKLSIVECTTYMAQSVSSGLIFELYTKENAPKLCQMLYVAIELAKIEQLKSLKIAAIECIMALARILDDDEFRDIVIRKQVSEVFLFFLPGIASGLKKIALEDEKIGHRVPVIALKAWGRIVTLLMQDYINATADINFKNVKESCDFKAQLSPKELKNGVDSGVLTKNVKKQKFKDNNEIKEYLKNSKISSLWYKDTDTKLYPLVVEFTKLVHHSHFKVRLELCSMCELIINNCLTTMPRSGSVLIEIVIGLTEDEDKTVSQESDCVLRKLSSRLSSDSLKSLLESLEEGFFNGINRLPRKFNSVDEREQLSSLNLLIGYLTLFGEHRLNQVLLSGDQLKKLLQTLIHISELEKCSTGLFEELSIKDFDVSADSKPLWKKFHYFKEDSVTLKLENLCSLLGQYETFKLVSDYLLDVLLYEPEHRKEAIFILNEVILGTRYSSNTHDVIKDILNTYLDAAYWQVPLTVMNDELGHQCTLAEVQHNAIQVCLLVEGIGKISLLLKEHFKEFLFKTLYLVLEKAGNNHSLVRTAGLLALKNITISCGYSDITDLITSNIDYFTYHVERRLNKPGDKENVLNVFSVVLNYSTVDVLGYVGDIIQEVLVLSCDKFQSHYATAYLQVFKIFIHCLWRWFSIAVTVTPIKSKAQKLSEIEEFEISGVKNKNDVSDETQKSVEEILEEDMQKTQEDLKKEIEEPDAEEYKKPDPPLHIKITVAILTRTLHFLPSKDRTRKLLVLEILSMGLEVIRDWEDELLPIVHQIWSPLVQRFKEYHDPLIINYSFQLLVVLARLSKEFIRMRTTKEVLPSIVEVLEKLAKESYLKDKGSAYRYSQNYKLQLMIVGNLDRILVDLDVQDQIIQNISDTIFKYLSDKQPTFLQNAALGFFKTTAKYDPALVINKMVIWNTKHNDDEYTKSLVQLNCIIQEIKCL